VSDTPAAMAPRPESEAAPPPPRPPEQPPGEVNGPPGPEPTRFGDWEKGGRCTDF
jgi:hypothetical protein